MDNIALQLDEIEVLKSIYNDQWVVEDIPFTYSIEISKDVKLFITLPPEYPSDMPPKYELLAPTLSGSQKLSVDNEFKSIYETYRGEAILYQWIEKLREIALQFGKRKEEEDIVDNTEVEFEARIIKPKTLENVVHGTTIIDRKSVFQGHACYVYNQEDIRDFLNLLLENKKIAQATHNISAYRIDNEKNLIQDCDDDGETHAGGRLLHLLEILNVKNVMVVVTRWYGGIHLGPDRFKHINNAARQVLLQGGFIKS